MLNEREIIDVIISKIRPNVRPSSNKNRMGTDDVSIVSLRDANPPTSLALKCDMIVESTDVPKGMKPWQIARKSISACISDLSAKGIKPEVSLVSLGIPRAYSKTDIEDLAEGFRVASKEFGVRIVGGDTNEAKELIIDCTMIGLLKDSETIIPSRNGAKPGDVILVSGEFGYTSSGLKILTKNMKAYGGFKDRAISSIMQPRPAKKFGISLAKYFSASIDSSDGLSISLYELATQSGVNFLVDNMPSAKGVRRFAIDNHLDYKRLVFYGGEEYEIVATISQPNLSKAMSAARRLKLKLIVIGKVEKGTGKVFLLANKTGKRIQLQDRGYVHLNHGRRSSR
jgi:thiamine-monophosphate kinase